jgi:hypothetical protein
MNVWQYYEMFKGFLRAIGFQEYSILEGACSLAFNDSNDEGLMKKLMKEYELQDAQVHNDDDYYALQEEYEKLKELKDKTPLTCDKDDKSKECEDAWGKFWNDDHSKALTYDEMIAEGYEMTADGFWVPGENMKVTTNNPMLAWNGLIPGSKEAVKKGCKCPVMDNAEMPEDRKWVNGDCPLHGKAK